VTFGDEYDGRSGLVRLIVGAVVGALVVAVIWLTWLNLDSRDSAEPGNLGNRTAVQTSGGSDESSRGSDGETSSVGARCEKVVAEQATPLLAAARSLGQWEIHVGAMNQLVAGAISLEEAQRYWEQTREGAERRLAAYDSAMEEWRQRGARCPRPENLRPRSRAAKCIHAVEGRTRALRAAATSLKTWREHVHHMEMLRDGTMSPEEATRLWLASWRAGDRELQVYGQASREAASLSC
jgi:hypothetical protein